ncbi:MAG: hypothetical protein JF615_14525 [Asticcacaulis sp.]|nr:hypothetical protein [Asticcacaulis sp.]
MPQATCWRSDHWLTPIDLPNGCVETRYYNQDSYNSGTAVISGNIDKNLKCPPQDPNNNHDNPWQQQPDYILGSSLGGAGEAACAALPSGRTQGVSAGLGGLGGGEAGGEEVLNYRTGATSGFGFAGAFFGWNGGASVTASTGFAWGLNDDNSNYAGGFSGASLSGPAIGGFVARSSNSFQAGTGIKGFVPAPIGTKGAVTVVGLSVGANLTGGAGGGVHFTNYTRPVQLGRFGPGWTFSDYIMYGLNQFCN